MCSLNSEIAKHHYAPARAIQAQGWPSLGLRRHSSHLKSQASSLKPPPRRGALLLVCLSLLVLFAVMSITFVMIAGQYRRGSKAEGSHERYADNFQKQLDDVLGQIVRDVAVPSAGTSPSALANHSLLNDFSGTELVEGTVGAAISPLPVGNQILEIPVSAPSQMSVFAGYYNGCVLTMLSGNAGIRSSRIVGYRPGANTDSGTVRVVAFEGGVVPSAGDRLIINGRPFNGTGFGYNITTGKLNAVDAAGFPLALAPHHRYSTTGPMWRGADEDYDAPDSQNMLLAFMPAAPASSAQIMPSLHRPDLINYLAQTDVSPGVKFWNDTATSIVGGSPVAPLNTNGAYRQRQAMLRPHPADHVYQDTDGNGTFTFADNGAPDLDGSGAATTGEFDFTGKRFDPIHGPWDVDNDGDAVMDSVWVDLGSPVQTAADGRKYKPLFAVLCLDLDGRLNVNAHGSFSQIDMGPDNTWNNSDDPHTTAISDPSSTPVFAGTMSGASPYSVTLPRGLGFGPAEINLTAVFSRDEVEKLFRGDGAYGYPGRYGETPGGVVEAGVTGTPSDLMRIRFSQFTNDHTTAVPRSAFQAPSDVWGRGSMGLDLRGQPLYWKPQWANEVLSNPYSLNLSRTTVRPTGTGAVDNPFTVAELERVLRAYDVDASSLPDRLVELPNTADPSYPGSRPNTAINRRHLLTTDSYDVPTPAPSLTREMIEDTTNGLAAVTPNVPDPVYKQLAGMVGMSVADYLRGMLIKGRGYNPLSLSAAEIGKLNADLASMFDTEVIGGLRMNLNRPFGNGRDDIVNGVSNDVVDEPGEQSAETILPDLPAITGFDGTQPFDHDNDGMTGTADPDDQLARYRFAKQLFILAMMLRDGGYAYPTTETLPAAPPGQPSSAQELTIRRIAQWAVNVADFRDSDAIMTPFEYDVNPFDGWSVDGVVGENPGPNGTQGDGDDGHPGEDGIYGNSDDQAADFDDTNAQRRLVWGCESPELLLTETLAFHDRRVADTNKDTTAERRDENGDNMAEDDDLDQVLVPQGSAFFELYCTRGSNNPVYPAELYTDVAGAWFLDLSRVAPANTAGLQYPVWRLAITETVGDDPDNDVTTLLASRPDSIAFNPPQTCGVSGALSMLPGASADGLQLERIVWLANLPPTSHVDADKTYYSRNASFNLLSPGGYALIGPRKETVIGAKETPMGTPSDQRISLDPIGITMSDTSANFPAGEVKNPIGIVVAGAVPATWVADPTQSAALGAGYGEGIGISISEPLFSSVNYYDEPTVANANNGNKMEAYGDITAGPFRDQPFDAKANVPLTGVTNMGLQGNLKRTVFLQRLANPLLPWNPEHGQPGHEHDRPVNPYLTVDWMPIDLTVFNGLANMPSGHNAAIAPWDPQAQNAPVADFVFSTRQRGDVTTTTYNLWNPVNSEEPSATPADNQFAGDVFGFDLKMNTTHTLGYINKAFHDTTGTKSTLWLSPSTTEATISGIFHGDPWQPFPHISFYNRPFANPLEVVQVPASGPDRLCLEVSFASADNPYGGAAGSGYAPFRHLLNFFHDQAAGQSPHLARLFDYLRVPSPFVGAETLLNPTTFAGPDMASGVSTGREGLHPPFNRVSNFREPGKININTIASAEVWTGILNGHPGPTFPNIVSSRRGYGANTDGTIFDANNLPPGSPTVFANPFRSAPGGLRFTPGSPPEAGLKEVDATLLRSIGLPADTSNNNGSPLFVRSHAEPYRHTDRNSQFRYEELQRMSGLVTGRSNVYAIWVTMGYFEVEQATGSYNTTVYPDGYRLKQELGADTGEITRHRAFYIYDRTIPVGYQRGKDLNIEKGILLKRMIE